MPQIAGITEVSQPPSLFPFADRDEYRCYALWCVGVCVDLCMQVSWGGLRSGTAGSQGNSRLFEELPDHFP